MPLRQREDERGDADQEQRRHDEQPANVASLHARDRNKVVAWSRA